MSPLQGMTGTEAATGQAGSGKRLLSSSASRERFGRLLSFLSVVGRGGLKALTWSQGSRGRIGAKAPPERS